MSHCPNCQAPIPDDFGLIECKNCGASIFVEFDGTVALPPEESALEHNTASNTAAIEFAQPVTSEPEEFLTDESFDIMPQSVVKDTPTLTTSEAHLDELQDFANSPLSQGREGLLRVNLTISGIDTADLRNLVYEALLDKKFLWDADGMIKSVQSGQLFIQDLPSVKAAVLLLRLKNVPVSVSWEQHAIHQA